MRLIDSFVGMCIEKDYISQENAEWLQYALEKRIATVVCFVPLLILGFIISSPATVIGFLATFYLLRTRTNGFHAKSIYSCLICSILAEVLFLKVLPSIWNNTIAFLTLTISIMLIWFYAPYNHPAMHLTSGEVSACAKSVKKRLCVLMVLLGVLCVQNMHQFALGILLGIVMTSATLVMAYCLQGIMPENNNT